MTQTLSKTNRSAYSEGHLELRPHASLRIPSIDVLRAVVMLLMILVNDLSSVSNLPKWIGHAEVTESRLGFADTIFPAFLFIAGLSIPLAINGKIKQGKTSLSIALYILGRSLALIIMGFFHVNAETYNDASGLPKATWIFLVTSAFFLIWLQYPKGFTKGKIFILRLVGVLLLLGMAYVYKGENKGQLGGMQPSWWGILGIIGWAYLVTSFLFLVSRKYVIAQAFLLLAFCTINLLTHLNLVPFSIPIVNDASSIALMLFGTCTVTLYATQRSNIVIYLPLAALLLIALGMLLSPITGGISKINSTPAWVFICAGISGLTFYSFIILIDRKNKANWFNLIKPAGTSTLTCYLIPYFLYSGFELLHFWYPGFLNSGLLGILRSLGVSFLIILFVGYIEKKELILKV
ncbi:DUF5009 domain-containing protein [Desertivirga arenae]|uniref:DUF5009 domain-containing protein n=1 Tax=Desertivirga arenae TaxID=2810309 RepID=UPI001A97A3D4|nr:DUF5009 domain-containing protein [Pedobacter sp. SYSU D00823]